MDNKSMTTMNVRLINQNKVYQAIYRERTTAKLQLVQILEMGLSTVSQNLKQLESAGLIQRDGLFDSTGGRKAQAIQIIPTARVAIGIGVLKSMLHFVAIDLYGQILCKETVPLHYAARQEYYQNVGNHLQEFIRTHNLDAATVLGVSIATQGVISKDGSRVDYGAIMDNAQMELADFEKYIPFPCRLIHDSKAAAVLELWNRPGMDNAVVLLLNRNLGGAIIANGIVQQGDHMRSGLVEHTCIQLDGPLCYCGKNGCLETFCSAERLEEISGMDAVTFFATLREGYSPKFEKLWCDYLDCLSFAICNLSVVLDGMFILCGYLTSYFTAEDMASLLNKVNYATPFPLEATQLALGSHGQYSPAVGGTLYYVKQFLASV